MRASAVLVTLTIASAAHAAPHGISVFESPNRSATTEGDALLATDPDTAFRVATDYARWAHIFPTVRSAVIDKRTQDAVEVTFAYRDGTSEHVRFRARPATRTITFVQLGGDADVSAEIAFAGGEVAGTTRVHSRLYADVHGVAGWFVSSSDVRARRQQQVRDDLAHLQAYFEAARPQ